MAVGLVFGAGGICLEFPGGPVVRTQSFHCHGLDLIPCWGTEILQATRCG